ncbi:unnamed protein product, partial [Bubo scandiacus]
MGKALGILDHLLSETPQKKSLETPVFTLLLLTLLTLNQEEDKSHKAVRLLG